MGVILVHLMVLKFGDPTRVCVRAWLIKQVFLIENSAPTFNARLQLAWNSSGVAGRAVAPLLERCRLSGMLLLTLFTSASLQLAACLAMVAHPSGAKFFAKFAGLGAVASGIGVDDGDQAVVYLFLNVSRVLGESLWQLHWQVSALMASGDRLADQPVLTISLLLTLVSTTQRGLELVMSGRKAAGDGDPAGVVIFCGLGVVILLMVCFSTLRIMMSQVCPEGEWNAAWPLMSGCVALPADLRLRG